MPWIIVSIIQLVFFMALIVAEVVGLAEAHFWTPLIGVFFQLGGFAYGCYIFICVWSFRLENLVSYFCFGKCLTYLWKKFRIFTFLPDFSSSLGNSCWMKEVGPSHPRPSICNFLSPSEAFIDWGLLWLRQWGLQCYIDGVQWRTPLNSLPKIYPLLTHTIVR